MAAMRVWGRRAFQAAGLHELTVSGKESRDGMARSEWVEPDSLGLVLAALMPANRLVMEVILATGLRVSDALAITREQVERGRFTVREQKTGKTRRVYIPRKLQLRILAQAGRVWAFEGRLDWKKHRTRAAVYKDVKRAAATFARTGRIRKGQQISPHSGRKVYAVAEYHRTGSLTRTGAALNHDPEHIAVTMLYALSDKTEGAELARVVGKPGPRTRRGSKQAR